MNVAVVGAGVSGLTCGLRLLERGLSVRIIARDPPWATTSAVAGAVWLPDRSRPDARAGPWVRRSYRVFEQLAATNGIPVSMVEMLWLSTDPLTADPWWFAALPSDRVRIANRYELPAGYADGWIVEVPCIQAPAYLDWLLQRFCDLGGTLELRAIDRLSQLSEVTVVNCSGLGARALAHDRTVHPVRGQVVYVRSTAPLRFMFDETGPAGLTYVFPRTDLVVLGGTVDDGDTSLAPCNEATRQILERTQHLQPALASSTLVGTAVGLRPSRHETRVEREEMSDGRTLVHNYGHGGHGFSLSWGCAHEVLHLLGVEPDLPAVPHSPEMAYIS